MRYATALDGPDAADDVVSAVVVRALARRGGLLGLRDPKQYLMTSVLNEVRSRHRKRQRQPVVHAEVGVAAAPVDTNGVVEVIAALPPRQRAAAYLVFYEQYTPSEAADLMGCRPATVRRYLHLARSKLQEALNG